MISKHIFDQNNWSQDRYYSNILFNSQGIHQPTGHYKTNPATDQFEEIKPYLATWRKRNALDIGARWGSFTVQLHKFGFEHVYMAEMRDMHFAGISYNVDMSRATLYPHPIMDQSGFISRSGKWISDREKGNIPCYSIDDMNINNVDFIKIDVDGPDRFVLAGAKNTIEKWKPVIYIEYGSEQIIWEKKLNNYDLKRKDLIPDGYDFIECEVESNNIILVPNGSR